jgi:hypothetical protein
MFFPKCANMCQYDTQDDKVCKNLKYVSIKFAQAYLHKCITWPNKSGKDHQEWNKICIEVGLKQPNTPMKTRLVLFLII